MVSLPEELHKQAKDKLINVSVASAIGIRIYLGLQCPNIEPCKCFKKSEALQDLLLKMEQKFLEMDDKFRRQRDVPWTIQEKRR